MASVKQIEANRRNAQNSTGPKTEEGKNTSRLNSLKHGLGAIHVPLPHEDPMEYHTIRQGLMDTWAPANTQEQLLVDTIASAWFRMQRASRFEAALMNGHILTLKRRHRKSEAPHPDDDLAIALALASKSLDLAWRHLERYEKRAQSAYYRGVETLRKVQKERKAEPARELRAEIEPVSPVPATKLASFRQQEPIVMPMPSEPVRFGAAPRGTSPELASNTETSPVPPRPDKG
jgi:hypothetical protein